MYTAMHDGCTLPVARAAGCVFMEKTFVVLGHTVLQNVLGNVYNVSVC